MPKFYGVIGYGKSQETPSGSGIWVDVITERSYYGDILRNSRQLDRSDQTNPNISVENSISVVADQDAIQNFKDIRYIEWNGVKWTVKDIRVEPPRLVLRLDQVYSGPTLEDS